MKRKLILFLIVGFASVVGILLYMRGYIYRSKASNTRLNIALLTDQSVNLANLNVGDSFNIDFVLQSDAKITGMDFSVVFYNSSQALDFVSMTQSSPAYFETTVANDVVAFSETGTDGVAVSKKKIRSVLVTKKNTSDLKNTATLHYKFRVAQTGKGIIRLRLDLSQVVGVGGLLAICKTGSVNCGGSDADNDIALTNISVGTSSTVTSGPVKVAVKLKFQGITTTPNRNAAISVKVKLGGGSSNLVPTTAQTVQFTTVGDGIYTGNTAFDVPPGNGYYVLVKGGSHVQKKVCQSTPTESVIGTYRCGSTPGITLQNGDNMFDLSGIYMLAGDLNLPGGQDGVVDSQDIGYIRQNLGSTDPAVLAIGDLNHDGNINQQDMSLILGSLAIKVDEE